MGILLLVHSISNSYTSYAQKVEQVSVEYEIQKGETLWTVAEKYCPKNMPLDQFVYENLYYENFGLLKSNEELSGRPLEVYPGNKIRVVYFKESGK